MPRPARTANKTSAVRTGELLLFPLRDSSEEIEPELLQLLLFLLFVSVVRAASRPIPACASVL
ncbi:MAG: hypothetical protein ACYTFI_17765, partial [Planctomycetota bacterium]